MLVKGATGQAFFGGDNTNIVDPKQFPMVQITINLSLKTDCRHNAHLVVTGGTIGVKTTTCSATNDDTIGVMAILIFEVYGTWS